MLECECVCRVLYRILSFGRGEGGGGGVLVVSSKREVYTARLSFISVVKEGGGWGDAEFLTTLCALYSFINALYIELLRKRNIFKGINPPPPP